MMPKILNKKGQVSSAVITLVTVFGIAIVVAILMATVAAKTYSSSTPWKDIQNATISADVNSAVENSFEAYNQATTNLPLLAIILVASVVLSIIAGFMVYSRGGGAGSL